MEIFRDFQDRWVDNQKEGLKNWKIHLWMIPKYVVGIPIHSNTDDKGPKFFSMQKAFPTQHYAYFAIQMCSMLKTGIATMI